MYVPGSSARRYTQRCQPRLSARPANSRTAARYSASAPARTLTRDTVSARGTSGRRLGELLQRLLHVGHEAVGIGAVHDPVIEREGQHALGPDGDAVAAVDRNDG